MQGRRFSVVGFENEEATQQEMGVASQSWDKPLADSQQNK